MSEFPDQSHINCVRDALWSSSTGGASLMVGAGFSRNAEKLRPEIGDMPEWKDLTILMYKTLYPSESTEWSSSSQPETPHAEASLRYAQEYEVAFGEHQLRDLIAKTIRDDCYEPGQIHERMLRLPWRDIFTTNWDTLLERTRSSVVQRGYGLVRAMKELPTSPRPRIVKLHGCLSIPNRLIFTEEDYRTYQAQYAPFVNTVQQAMMETVICLIGFSGEDPNFLHWSGWVRDNLGPSAPRIYLAGWLNLSPHRRRMLEARNVMPIDVAGHPQASTWPTDFRHRYSVEWLITSLEFGRPYDVSVWPDTPEDPAAAPESHLQPIQGTPSVLPKSEHTYDTEADGNDKTQPEQVRQIIRVWSHNRKLYPKWLVIPFEKVRDLSYKTEHWHDKILAALPTLESVERLSAIYELTWRKVTLMEPLQANLIEAASTMLDVIDYQIQTIEDEASDSVCQPDIQHKWLMVAASLVTQARHQLDGSMFDDWLFKLSSCQSDSPEIKNFLHHERCLWKAIQLDYDGLLEELANWDVRRAEPAWMIRKSALLFEVMANDEATFLVETALAAIREQPNESNSLANPSREAWALWLALRRKGFLVNMADERQKWEELSVLKCNALLELNKYSDALKEEGQVDAGLPFDLSYGHQDSISFSSTGYRRYMAACRAVSLVERAGLPPAQNGLRIASTILECAAKNLATHEPELAVRLVLRTAKYDKDNVLNSILSRSRIAMMDSEPAHSISLDLLAAIDFANSQIHSSKQIDKRSFWHERLRVFIEALSRFVVRLDEMTIALIFERALAFYAEDDIARHHWMEGPIRNLLKRTWEAMSNDQRSEQALNLLTSPIAEVNKFEVSGKSYPDPGELLMTTNVNCKRGTNDRAQWRVAARFVIQGMLLGGEARTRASVRMLWMLRQDKFSADELQDVISALWGADYASHNELPTGTDLLDWVFLTIPEPVEGLAEKRFRRKWMDAQRNHEGKYEDLIEALWQVGLAIEGRRSQGSPMVFSENESMGLAKTVTAWAHMRLPQPIAISSGRGSEAFIGKSKIELDRAIEGLRIILLEIDLAGVDAEILYKKVQQLKEYGVQTSKLSVGLVKTLPGRKEEISSDIRMALASDKEAVALDAVLGLKHWLRASNDKPGKIAEPPGDLVNELGVIIATRRSAAIAAALEAAKWIFENGTENQRNSILDNSLQGLGFLLEELSYERKDKAEFNLPLLRRGCTHLAIAISRHGHKEHQSVTKWMGKARTDPLPEVRNADLGEAAYLEKGET